MSGEPCLSTEPSSGEGKPRGLTSESQKSKSLIPVLKFCCLLASFSFWLFSADFCTRNCHWSAKAASRAWAREGSRWRWPTPRSAPSLEADLTPLTEEDGRCSQEPLSLASPQQHSQKSSVYFPKTAFQGHHQADGDAGSQIQPPLLPGPGGGELGDGVP